jgi:hypothetical protein
MSRLALVRQTDAGRTTSTIMSTELDGRFSVAAEAGYPVMTNTWGALRARYCAPIRARAASEAWTARATVLACVAAGWRVWLGNSPHKMSALAWFSVIAAVGPSGKLPASGTNQERT